MCSLDDKEIAMDEKMLIRYLNDIVELETQRNIALNTRNQLVISEKNKSYAEHIGNLPEHGKASIGKVAKRIRWGHLILKIYAALLVVSILGGIVETILFSESNDVIRAIFIVTVIMSVILIMVRKAFLDARVEIGLEYAETALYYKKAEKDRDILIHIRKEKPKLNQAITQYNDTLRKLYSLNIIHPNYREFVPCGMFLQYLSTGRTHSLEQRGGDKGAYNLYEDDLKYQRITSQLNQIMKNQTIMYEAVTQIQSKVDTLCDSVERIEQYAEQTAKNTKISAWCNAATAVNVNIMRRMQEEYYFYRR